MSKSNISRVDDNPRNKRIQKFIVVLGIFLFSLSLRMWNLNIAGRTWDEQAYVGAGNEYIELLKKGDFQNSKWYEFPDHPPVAKYLYGIASEFDIVSRLENGQPIFQYDWTYSRMISVLFSSLTVVLIVLFGWKYFSQTVGILAGIILSTLPILLGLSQLITIESILIFFFTLAIYYLLVTLENPTKKNIIICGIILGLALGVKYSNIKLIPIYCIISCVYYLLKRRESFKKLFIINGIIFSIAIVIFILLWPALLFHASQTWQNMYSYRFKQNGNSGLELFWGKYIHVPVQYYLVYFLITTPLIYLIFCCLGIINAYKNKNWIIYVLLIWFIFPFFQSFYYMRQNGIRYIIEIYAPLSLLSAIGFDKFSSKFTSKNIKKLLLFSPFLFYMLIIISSLSPYYLDYFNIVVGGVAGIHEKKLFSYGWWGEGQREAGMYIVSNAQPNSTVALVVQPKYVFPPLDGINFLAYSPSEQYNYIVINTFYLINNPFDIKSITTNYFPIYVVNAQGAPLVTVYKHK